MYSLCVFLLIFFFAQCESALKTRRVSSSFNNVGKFRREAVGNIESPVQIRDETGKNGLLIRRNRLFNDLSRPALSEIKSLGFSNILDKLTLVSGNTSQQVPPAFGKLTKDGFNKIAWKLPSDPSPVVSRDSTKLKINSLNEDTENRFKLENVHFKNYIEDNLSRFSEARKNKSEGPFQHPEALKVNSQIKDLINQSFFSRPTLFKSKPFKDSPFGVSGTFEGLDRKSNSKMFQSKNISDISSLSKPEISQQKFPFFSVKTIMVDNKPLFPQGGQLNVYNQSVSENEVLKNEEKKIRKQNDFDITDLLKNKNSESNEEEGAIKSARRLFDVIQSQNPLDLLNIPLLMDNFKIGPSGLNSKTSISNLGNNPLLSAAYKEKLIPSDLTSQKSVTSKDCNSRGNENLIFSPMDTKMLETTISKPLCLISSRNHSWSGNALPWESLTSILTHSLPNMPLLLIPLNKVHLDQVISPEKDSLSFHLNTDLNKTFVPLAEEMKKVFNYQDLFSNNFNDFRFKDLLEFGITRQKPQEKLGDILNITAVSNQKTPEEMEFQSRVKEFLKMSRQNVSDFHRKLGAIEKLETLPDEESIQMLGLTKTLNSSSKAHETQKSKIHDRVSVLPLLKVTANMALSKYSNIPIIQGQNPKVDKKMLGDNLESQGNVRLNLSEAVGVPISCTLATVAYKDNESSSIYTNSEVPTVTDKISTEANLNEGLSDLEGPVLGNSSGSFEFTDPSFFLKAETSKTNESEALPLAEPFSAAVMKTVANNLIWQTLKEFEQTLNLNPKFLDQEKSNQTNSFNERDNLSTKEPGLNIVQSVTIGNQFASLDNETLDEKEKTETDISAVTNDVNPISRNDIFPNDLSTEEDKIMASTATDSEAEIVLATENIDLKNNSFDFIENGTESVGNINLEQSLLKMDDMKLNLAQIKELLPTAVNEDTVNKAKHINNLLLRKIANNWDSSLSLASEVNDPSLTSIGKSESSSPEVTISNIAQNKDESENWDNINSVFGNASYYVSNKTNQCIEFNGHKDIKNEALQLPAILVELLSRIDLPNVNCACSGYNVVFVTPHKNDPENIIGATEETNIPFEAKPKNTETNYCDDIPVKGTLKPITLTTGNPAFSNPDNIYQVVTYNNDFEKSSTKQMALTPAPQFEDCVLYHNKVGEKAEPTYDFKFSQKPILPFSNNNPIIIVAIDPLKAWEGQHRSTGHMPLGIIIKSSSLVDRPELNQTALRCGTALIGEPGPSYAEFKCTTTCPVESWKCKEVTLFPIYPMYPVYPLKPIIASNDTTTLMAKTK